MRIFCPDCGEVCRVRTSQKLDSLLRRAYVMCQDIECGYRGSIHIEHVARLSATGKEKDKRIPYTESLKRHLQIALIGDESDASKEGNDQ
nr:ogr/Delta-like zinc finger family protein [Marinobacter oulmenensis]